MPSRHRSTARRAACLAILALSTACGRGTLPISRLLDDPSRYDGERVKIEGRVTGFSFGALGRGAYQVDDGTGEMTVVAEGSRVPTRGARVRVRGRLQEFGTFGDRTVGLHLKQESVSIRR